jgi:hypothetical protein
MNHPYLPVLIFFGVALAVLRVLAARLREAIMEVRSKPGKNTKGLSLDGPVDRISYKYLRHGFMFASAEQTKFFPLLSLEDVERKRAGSSRECLKLQGWEELHRREKQASEIDRRDGRDRPRPVLALHQRCGIADRNQSAVEARLGKPGAGDRERHSDRPMGHHQPHGPRRLRRVLAGG